MKIQPRRYVRLLPSVMLVCGGLLILKASGIVHDAYALEGSPAAADAMAPIAAPVNKDYAGDDMQVASAAEVDVLTSLTKRRVELDAREAQIQIQANMLAATESRVDTKIAQLKGLQDQITALLAQRDAAQQKQVDALIKTYSGMKDASAAAIFSTLPDEVLIPVAQGMKADVLGAILSKMNPDAAQKLTVKLANKLALPETAQALAPVTPPSPVPGPTGSAAPASPAPAGPAKTASNAAPAAKAPAPSPKSGG
jgi:flagellar motility protein MotE (MotC chaperone)